MSTSAEIQSHQVRLESFLRELQSTQSEANRTRKNLWISQLRRLYFQFAKTLRQPQEAYDLWDTGVLLVLPAAVAVIAFILFYSLGLQTITISIGLIAISITTGVALGLALTTPQTDQLPGLIAEEATKTLELSRQLSSLKESIRQLKWQIGSTKTSIKNLLASNRLKREMLLKENWRAMRDVDWKKYLVRVFEALGAQASMTKTTGDQGVDLVVIFGSNRIAIQAKGYEKSVGNSAVQQVAAGKNHYGCNKAAVITNSYFTPAAHELADSNSVILIGMKEFPAFVLGSNLEIFN